MNIKKTALLLALGSTVIGFPARAEDPASGPLRVSAVNPRYFADGTGHIVYLTGTHTWNNLQDMGPADPPLMKSAVVNISSSEPLGTSWTGLLEMTMWPLPCQNAATGEKQQSAKTIHQC